MPINVIIVAALALMVLVILIAIFTGRVKIFSENLQSCTAKQGKCLLECSSNTAIVTNTDCEKQKQVCCVTVFENEDKKPTATYP